MIIIGVIKLVAGILATIEAFGLQDVSGYAKFILILASSGYALMGIDNIIDNKR